MVVIIGVDRCEKHITYDSQSDIKGRVVKVVIFEEVSWRGSSSSSSNSSLTSERCSIIIICFYK